MSLVLLALHSDEGRLGAILAAVGMSALRRLQPGECANNGRCRVSGELRCA